ncbi:MAG: hypothetical protein V1782_02925 [Pseudomonadota bacterium]
MASIEFNRKNYEFDANPDHCPICHHGIEAIHIGSNVVERKLAEGDLLQILYRCPRKACQRAFIGTYRQNTAYQRYQPAGPFILRNTEPYRAEEPEIPVEIKNISPGYVEVYSQSIAAEALQLDQISGVGYRKALEYLIKDYVIHKNKDKEEEIKKAFLGVCINEYVDDANVKSCAQRATWLGNDETHYVRKWAEKDINDLKVLIKLTQAWILNNLLTEKYLREMK